MKKAVLSRFKNHGSTLGQLAAVGMMFSMPLSRAAYNTFALLLIIGWITSGAYRNLLPDCRKNPALIMCIAFFGWLLFSVSYSIGTNSEKWGQVSIYSKLLYIPILVGVLKDPSWIRRSWIAIFSGLTTLLVLFAADFWVDIPGSHSVRRGSLGILNNTITQGLQLATLTLLGLHLWMNNSKKFTFTYWLIIASTIGAIVAVLFFNPARGAQLGLLVGLVALSIFHTSGRSRWIAGISTALLFLLISLTASNVTTRFELALNEARVASSEKNTSIGARLNAWRISSEIWKQSPWLGKGAGAYRHLMYTKYTDEIGICPSPTCEHPHNQYLLTLVEQGSVGAVLLLGLLWFSARMPNSGHSNLRTLSSAFVLLFSVHSFFEAGLQMTSQVFIVVLGLIFATATSGIRSTGFSSATISTVGESPSGPTRIR